MNTKLSHILILCLALALLATLPVSAQGGAGVITFQGQLADANGEFLTGAYNLRFTIYDAETGGTALWGPETHNSVPVSQGLFVVQLGSIEALDGTIFDGVARWLEMAVWNGAAWEPLSPRLLMGGAAYALSAGGLPPGTTLSGAGDAILSVVNTAGSQALQASGGPAGQSGAADATPLAGSASDEVLDGEGSRFGVVGETDSSSFRSVGVYGEASATSGLAIGVDGKSASTEGAGVRGWATADNGRTAGVVGLSYSTDGRGVYGEASATSGDTYGVEGKSNSTEGIGVYGEATAATGQTYGGYFKSAGHLGTGVFGLATNTNGEAYGVKGETMSGAGMPAGVYGEATATSGSAFGVKGLTKSNSGSAAGVYGKAEATVGSVNGGYFESAADAGAGVFGEATAATGQTYGGYFKSASTAGRGVYGLATADSGDTYGVYGTSASNSGTGVYGEASATSGLAIGVDGKSASTEGAGVRGWATADNGRAAGVVGLSYSTDGRGVYGEASATSGTTYGVEGKSNSTSGRGVYGEASAASGATYGVYGKSNSGDGAAVYGEAGGQGVGVKARSEKGNVFEGYGSSGLVFKVDNSGNVFADGTYQSPAADFAEMLPGDEGLEPGDVLAIAADGRVTKASAENPLAIIGVYSTAPAFLGGRSFADSEQSPARVPVAILGVVPVKVSAENGPIRPNDPLAASSIPGYAARAIPLFVLDGGEGVYAGGSILGRALEGLDSGEGVIQVLLQLR